MNAIDKIKKNITDEFTAPQSASLADHHCAKVVAVCSQKGGVGKTTTAVNLSAALAGFHNKKTLVIDLDPQGHVEKSLCAIVESDIDYAPLSQILLAKKGQILDAIVQTKNKNLHLTPGDKALYETESQLASKLGREHILARSLAAARTQYDYIFIDCPPSLGNLTINALCVADYILIPCEMSVLAFEGVTDLLDTFDVITERLNKKLKILGVLFTRVDGRNLQMNNLVKENMRKFFKGSIFKTEIAINTDLNKAQLEGVPVFDFDGSSSGSKNYKSLADEVLGLTTGRKIAPKLRLRSPH